jgi:hypothetical protein
MSQRLSSILNYEPIIISEYNLRKFYQSIFYKDTTIKEGKILVTNLNCSYINKYGVNCKNRCTLHSPFIIRDYFCEIHIKNQINDIIKFNTFIYRFEHIKNIINNLLLQIINTGHGFISLKLNLRKFIKKMFQFIQENINYLLLSQVFINTTHDMIFNCFTQHIYELNEFKIHVNFLKYFSFENIVNVNKKYRKDIIETLIDLTNNSENYIGKVFMNSNIGDFNIFKIIEKYI